MKRIFLFAILAFAIFACDSEKEECVKSPESNIKEVAISFQQLQDTLANLSSKDEMVALFTREPVLRDFVFKRSEYPNDSVFINEIYARLSSPHLDTLLLETKRVFGDLSGLEAQFKEAFSNLKHYYPDFKMPKIQTVISGLDTDIVLVDSLIIVGLDFYLGKGARYRPQMYDYLLRKYDSDDIVPSIMLIYGISEIFNKTDLNDKTVLADMIAYGKSFHFAKQMLPCTPDSVLISYTPSEISGSRKNQDLIWARFIESEVLYSTSHVVKKEYLGERPITLQVGEKCPGRIGQWVGWEIVDRFMETHPKMTLPELMSMNNAQQIFKQSRYKPQKR
jgi:hypothetical protein